MIAEPEHSAEGLVHALPLDEVLPIVREVRALGAIAFEGDRDVLGIYVEGVVIYRSSGADTLSPLAYYPGGWNVIASAKSKGNKVILRWQNIAAVSVSGLQFYGNRVLAGRERGRWFRFTTEDNSYAEVFLSEGDSELPRAVLGRLTSRIQDDVPIDPPAAGGRRLSSPPSSSLLRLLVGAVLVSAIAPVLFAMNRDWLFLMIPVMPAGAVALVGWPCVVGRALLAPPTHYARERRKSRRGSRAFRNLGPPLHSKLGGALLKVCAAILALGATYAQFHLIEHPEKFRLAQYWSGLLFLPSAMLAHLGHRVSRLLAREVLAKDARAPILYLRAFVHDDTGNYNPDTWLSKALGCRPIFSRALGGAANPLLPNIVRMLLGRATEIAEEQFATGIRSFGPLVALGRPGERIQAGGAARLYLDEQAWQPTVLELMASSQLIVAEAGTGEHLWWEMEQASRRHLDKLVISFRGMNGQQSAHDTFRLRFMLERCVPLPRCGRHLMFVIVRGGASHIVPEFRHPPILWPLIGSAIDFRRVFEHIRAFNPGASGDRPASQQVRASFPAAASAIVAWNLLVGSVLYLLFIVALGLLS